MYVVHVVQGVHPHVRRAPPCGSHGGAGRAGLHAAAHGGGGGGPGGVIYMPPPPPPKEEATALPPRVRPSSSLARAAATFGQLLAPRQRSAAAGTLVPLTARHAAAPLASQPRPAGSLQALRVREGGAATALLQPAAAAALDQLAAPLPATAKGLQPRAAAAPPASGPLGVSGLPMEVTKQQPWAPYVRPPSALSDPRRAGAPAVADALGAAAPPQRATAALGVASWPLAPPAGLAAAAHPGGFSTGGFSTGGGSGGAAAGGGPPGLSQLPAASLRLARAGVALMCLAAAAAFMSIVWGEAARGPRAPAAGGASASGGVAEAAAALAARRAGDAAAEAAAEDDAPGFHAWMVQRLRATMQQFGDEQEMLRAELSVLRALAKKAAPAARWAGPWGGGAAALAASAGGGGGGGGAVAEDAPAASAGGAWGHMRRLLGGGSARPPQPEPASAAASAAVDAHGPVASPAEELSPAAIAARIAEIEEQLVSLDVLRAALAAEADQQAQQLAQQHGVLADSH